MLDLVGTPQRSPRPTLVAQSAQGNGHSGNVPASPISITVIATRRNRCLSVRSLGLLKPPTARLACNHYFCRCARPTRKPPPSLLYHASGRPFIGYTLRGVGCHGGTGNHPLAPLCQASIIPLQGGLSLYFPPPYPMALLTRQAGAHGAAAGRASRSRCCARRSVRCARRPPTAGRSRMTPRSTTSPPYSRT